MGMVKTGQELRLLKKAAAIANSCIPLIEQSLKEDITEAELRRRIGRKIRNQGAGLSFRTLVACGKRSAMIHPKPAATDKKITGLGYVDFGASYNGYKSDVTVPFVKGQISKKEKRIVATTLKAYKLAVSSIKPNQFCWKLFEKISDYLEKNGFELKHGLGHGLGLKIHEYPFMVMPKKEKLKRKTKRRWNVIKKIKFQENMLFTIEPGVYVKGLGGCRIENDFLLSNNKVVRLTNSRLISV